MGFNTDILSATTISGGTFYGDGSNLTGVGSNLSKTLFVDPNGNDTTAVKGDLNKPYANLYAARNAATSGDTIYVLPGTWTYDNRNSAGNPFNGQIDNLVNLWKNGIYYYFSPGSKIVFFNQTITGEGMYLFKNIGVNTTCVVSGSLEFSGSSIGSAGGNGQVQYFVPNSDDNAFNFYSETKSIITTTAPISNRNGTTTGQTANVIIYSDELYCTHLADGVGQVGSGWAMDCRSVPPTNYFYKVRRAISFAYGVLRCRSVSIGSNVFVDVDEASNEGDPAGFYAIEFTSCASPSMVLNFKKLSYRTGLWAISSNASTMNATLNANLFESNTSVRAFPTSVINSGTLTFNGTVNINNNNRTLFENNGSFNLNLNCDINATIANYTNTLIRHLNIGTTNFKGNIGGNFQGQVAVCRNGRLNISDSTITSNLTGGVVLSNDVTNSTGSTSITNTKIIFSGTSALFNGQHSNYYISNSSIRNSGSGNLFINTTNAGTLQIHNSTLQSVAGSTVDITGAAPLTISNSTSNTSVSAVTLNGSPTVLTQLVIL
jgi:hypothetical protein